MSGPFRSFLPIEGEEEDRYCGYVDPSVSKLYLMVVPKRCVFHPSSGAEV